MKINNYLFGNQEELAECYDQLKQDVTPAQLVKANQFVNNGLVQVIGDNIYYVYPIKNYNKSIRTVHFGDGIAICTCQHSMKECQKGNDGICSHIIAVALFIKNRNILPSYEEKLPIPTLKYGQRIRIIKSVIGANQSGIRKRSKGTIEEVHHDSYIVRFDNGHVYTMLPSEIEAIND